VAAADDLAGASEGPGHRWAGDRPFPERSRALRAEELVQFTRRKHEQQLFADRLRSATFWAVKLAGGKRSDCCDMGLMWRCPADFQLRRRLGTKCTPSRAAAPVHGPGRAGSPLPAARTHTNDGAHGATWLMGLARVTRPLGGDVKRHSRNAAAVGSSPLANPPGSG